MPVGRQCVLWANIPVTDCSEGEHVRESRTEQWCRQKDLRMGRQPRPDICRPYHETWVVVWTWSQGISNQGHELVFRRQTGIFALWHSESWKEQPMFSPPQRFHSHRDDLEATWEVVRIQQSRFCQFPAFRNLPWDEWYIKCIHLLRRCRKRNKKLVFREP